ncbi:type II secretion system F family protein [Mycolicibacterium sp. GCM10028919]|uniref:type II secretion system F family protein n=1 Tax=Mycolicibacterium sp. GCM10028919 TaxID=3273401 RepID=UPI003608E6B9
MTGSTAAVAALALASAVLLAPTSPRTRLVRLEARRRTLGRGPVTAAALAALGILAAVVPIPVVAAAAVLAATLGRRTLASRRHGRRSEEAGVLQSGLAVLIGELRVGAHPVAAFETAARETHGPVAAALSDVAARARLGADVGSGLLAVADGSASPVYWERLSACWGLAQAHGLAIATLLRTAQRDIVERERFASRVRAGMAGARATAAILAGLPMLGIGLGQLIGADPVRFLLSDGLGGWLLLVGTGLVCAGLLWSDGIVNRVVS